MRILSTCFHRPVHELPHCSAEGCYQACLGSSPCQSGVLFTLLMPFECPFGTIGTSTIAAAIAVCAESPETQARQTVILPPLSAVGHGRQMRLGRVSTRYFDGRDCVCTIYEPQAAFAGVRRRMSAVGPCLRGSAFLRLSREPISEHKILA